MILFGLLKSNICRYFYGVNVLRYKKKKPSKHVCAECGAVLHGVPRGRPYEIGKLAKSQKRPNRPFGGYLCPKCARKPSL